MFGEKAEPLSYHLPSLNQFEKEVGQGTDKDQCEKEIVEEYHIWIYTGAKPR